MEYQRRPLRINVYLRDDALRRRLEEVAQERGLSLSFVIRETLREALNERQENQHVQKAKTGRA